MFRSIRRPLFLFQTPEVPAGTPPAAPVVPAATPPAAPAPGSPEAIAAAAAQVAAAQAAAGGAPPAAPAAPSAAPADQAVPYDRFKQVNDALQVQQAEVARLQAAATAQQRQGMPELERMRAELTDATTAMQAAQAQITTLTSATQNAERAGWVRDAAANPAAKFHDPADALAKVDLTKVETVADAQRLVGEVAANPAYKHLVQAPAATPTVPDMLAQVLDRGTPTVPGAAPAGAPVALPPATFNAMNIDQLVALQEAQPDVYAASLAAANQAP
jgi:hypothetical protein